MVKSQLSTNIHLSTFLAAVFFLIVVGIQINLAWRDAQTSDEGVHLAAGLTYLTNHDFRLNPEHPPLVKMVAAAPLLLTTVNQASNFNQWWSAAGNFYTDSWEINRQYAQALIFDSGNNADWLIFLGRLGPIAIFSALLLATFFVCKMLYNAWTGLAAIILIGFNPNIMAHGHLITTDIAASLGTLLTIIALWFYIQKRTLRQAMWLGVALGLALITKFTTVLLMPLVIGWILIDWIWLTRRPLRLLCGHFLTIMTIAYTIILFAYFPQWKSPPQTTLITEMVTQTDDGLSAINRTPFLRVVGQIRHLFVPKDYYKGLFLVLTHTQFGHDSYLFGQFSKTGWWYYFPAVIAIKTPIVELALICFAILTVWKRPKFDSQTFLITSALSLLVFSMTSKANLGIRHTLPILGLLIIPACARLLEWGKRGKTVLIIFCAIIIIEAISIYPNYISYVNQLFGGQKMGPYAVSDSNIDWGQDLKHIKSYLNSHDIGVPYVDYQWAGSQALAYYQISTRPLEQLTNDKSGFLIISTSALQKESFNWLRSKTTFDRITPSVWVYKLDD